MPLPVTLQNETAHHTTIISAGASLSAAVRIPNGHELAAIIMPAVWTAAGITFQASYRSGSYANAFDAAGDELTLVVVATHYVPMPKQSLHGAVFVKVRSGTSGVPVNQVAACTVTLLTRPTS
ncbi:MAG: hypothetical protein MUQ65_12120 [Armatimonadetes bacterium]|nr:hypothetical protein [Armatimonadota bacterium]